MDELIEAQKELEQDLKKLERRIQQETITISTLMVALIGLLIYSFYKLGVLSRLVIDTGC